MKKARAMRAPMAGLALAAFLSLEVSKAELVQVDLGAHLEHEFGGESRDRYCAILEQLRPHVGYVDYLGALQRSRLATANDPRLLQMSSFLIDYPFASRLYPLDAIRHLRTWGLTAAPKPKAERQGQPKENT